MHIYTIMVINYIQQSGNQYVHVYRLTHNYGAISLLFASPLWFPFASLIFPFTYLEILLGVIGSCPPWSQVARKLIFPFPSPPHSKVLTPWGFPELNMRLTKTTSRIRLTRFTKKGLSACECLQRNNLS